MNILFLSHYFPPEVNAPATRTFEHCREWVKQGHNVTVVTCAPNHPKGKVFEGYSNKWLVRESIEGINVIRIKTYITANEGFLKRTLGYFSYMLSCLLLSRSFGSCDVVLTTSPQFFNGLAGYFVSRFKKVPWILEIRDLWPDSILAVGAIKNKYIIGFLEFLESFAYRKADKIVAVTNAFRVHIKSKGIDESKIIVIRNGADLGFFNPDVSVKAPSRESELYGLDFSGKFVASYVGTHGMAHHLETILEAAKILEGHPNIQFLMVGEGAERAKLLELKESMGLENVKMVSQQPKDLMPWLWQHTSVSLVLLRKTDLFKTVIPSKIFETMAMRKPIILGVEGESREIIEAAGAGLAIEPESAEQLASTVLKFASDSQIAEECGKAGASYVSEHFDRSKLAIRFLEEILEVSKPEAQSIDSKNPTA